MTSDGYADCHDSQIRGSVLLSLLFFMEKYWNQKNVIFAVRRPAKAERAVLFINPSLNNIVVLFIDFAPVAICFQIHYL